MNLKVATYAVSLYFDKKSSAEVLSCVRRVAEACGNFYMTEHEVPPHLTLGIFHASDGEVDKLKALFKEFAAAAGKAFQIEFDGVDSFLDKVAFLRIAEASRARLIELNTMLHKLFLASFEAGGNQNYLPQNWLPHVALAVKLKNDQLEKTMNLISEQPEILPKSAKVVSLGLAQCKPYEEVSRVSLCADTLTPLQRHKNMAAIRSTGNKLEVTLRSKLFRCGFRFRKNDRRLSGSPDIVFPHYNAVVFINGCFWHAHGQTFETVEAPSAFSARMPHSYAAANCAKFHFPHSNVDFWQKKFMRNRSRDLRNFAELLDGGWRICIVWECAITGANKNEKIDNVVEKIVYWLEEEPHEPWFEI